MLIGCRYTKFSDIKCDI